MTGRSDHAKHALIKQLFHNLQTQVDLNPADVEIIIQDQPACNWGFRGLTGTEVLEEGANKLAYSVKV